MHQFTLKIPATSANLGPGYDVVGMALNIYNTFDVTVGTPEKLVIEVSGEGAGKDGEAGELPTDETNLVYTTLVEGCRNAGVEVPNLHIRLHNEVPLNRGMGSSSTAVLAGLLIAREISGGKLDEDTLIQTAVKIEGHPDNLTPAFYGGVVINYVEDDRYKTVRFIPPSPLKAVLLVPHIQISTRMARELLPARYSSKDMVHNLRSIALLVTALQTGQYHLLKTAMDDTVHTPYRAELIPNFYEVASAAKEAGAFGCAISGSGSTIIALCSGNEETIGRAMMRGFGEFAAKSRVMTADIAEAGVIVKSSIQI